MKPHLLIALAIIASAGSALAAPYPIQQARKHLERAHSMVTDLLSGGKGGIGKNKANLSNLVTALSDAELSLAAVKDGKGTNVNVALKFIGEAKTELAGAKEGSTEHLAEAQKSIGEALKRVMQAIEVNQRKH